jgi:hypothetical protein
MANNQFELVIPAAGLGDRTGLLTPKGLYEIDGVPITRRIVNTIGATHTTIVVHPDFIRNWRDQFPDCLIIAQAPTGPAHAVEAGVRHSRFSKVIVCWGDMLHPSRETAHRIALMLTLRSKVVPIAYVKHPYTYCELGNGGQLLAVDETHVTGSRYADGWRDVGIFGIRSNFVFSGEKQFLPQMIGAATIEVGAEQGEDFNVMEDVE